MKILISNQCATNRGDRAVLYYLLRDLVSNGIMDITVSTTNPYLWEEFKEFPQAIIHFIPFGWSSWSPNRNSPGFLRKVLRRLKSMWYKKICFPLVRRLFLQDRCPWYVRYLCTRDYWEALNHCDLVIGTGGHRITTLLSRDAVFPATFDMAIALMRQKSLIQWSQTIGPLVFSNPANREMVKKIIGRSAKVLVRDEVSKQEIIDMGVSLAHVSETRESVFGLFDIVDSHVKPSERPPVLGISVYTAQKRNYQENEAYLDALSTVVDHAIGCGYKVHFFPMEIPNADQPCFEGIIGKCKHKEACSIIEGFSNTPEHISSVAECRLFIGHKTHSVVFALTVGTPIIAIAYHKKTADFMKQFDLSEYCIPDAHLSGDRLIELFSKINFQLDEISQRELECSREIGSRVQGDLADLIADAQTGFK